MYFEEAVRYCEDLEYGGYKDWHLPSLEEMRTRIYGCQNTINEEKCNAQNIALEEPFISNCTCEIEKGPGENGHYVYPNVWGMDGGRKVLWTSTRAEKSKEPIVVAFFTGMIVVLPQGGFCGVRCVRKNDPAK
jgi:hypothetical protein